MNTARKLKCKTYPNNDHMIQFAENDEFRWSSADRNCLYHIPSERGIYQCHWLDASGRMAEFVGADIGGRIAEFWGDLEAARALIEQVYDTDAEDQPGDWYCVNEFGERELGEDY